MNVADYLTGLALLATILAGLGASAYSLRLWLVPGWSGPPALLAAIVLGVSLATVTCETLGVLGLLDAPALAVATIGPAIALLRVRPTRALAGAAPMARPDGRAGFVLAIGAALLCAIHWAGPVLHSLDVGIYRQDSTWYHLPFAAWFAQTGSVTGLLQTDPLKLAAWYYPLNSEMLHALGMVVFGNDLLSPLLNFGWLGVALLAAWCIGRPLGLAAATLLGAALVLDSDMMLVQAGNAPSDVAALACLLAAIAFLFTGTAAGNARGCDWKAARAGIDSGPLALAALSAGLTIGIKVTMLVPVAVLSAGLPVVFGRPGLRRRVVIWLGGIAIGGGFWYLRNLFHAGNPLPWITLGPLPGPSQEALYPRPAHSIAEYLADQHAWSHYFLPGFAETLGPLWFAVLFCAVAGICLGLRRRHGPVVQIVALAGLAALVAHVFNPVSASGPEAGPLGFASNLRYAAPGLAIGLVLLPLCETRTMARRVLVPAYAGIVAFGAIASNEWVQPNPIAAVAIGAAAVLVPAWLLLLRPAARLRRPALAGIALIAVLGGYAVQQHYFERRYLADAAPPLDNPGFRATRQWSLIQSWARDQHGMRIGLVGTPAAYGQYIFYGDDLSNVVRYLGEPGPHGGFTPIRTCRRWREIVDAGRFDAIVITPEDPGSPLPPPQISWTASTGAAVPAISALPAAVFLLTAPLNPYRCRRIEARGPLPLGPEAGGLPPGWWPGQFSSPN